MKYDYTLEATPQYYVAMDYMSRLVTDRTRNINDPKAVEEAIGGYLAEMKVTLRRKVKERVKKLKAMRKLKEEGKAIYEIDEWVRVKLHSKSFYAGRRGVVTHKERDRALTHKPWIYTLSIYRNGEPVDGLKFFEHELEETI